MKDMKQEMKMKAKTEMLKRLKSMMMDQDFGDLKPILGGKLKKVTVAAEDEEGLEKGLSLAEQILAKRKAMEEGGESEESEDESEEEYEEESEEGGECPICKGRHGSSKGKAFACGGMKSKY